MDNKLVTTQNQNNLLTRAKRYIHKLAMKSHNKKIINEFTYIKEYGVLSMPAFRIISDEMISNSPKGSIIMADINDLFVANKFRGKEKVNDMLKNMFDKVRTTLDESGCTNYKIGKMGDEIYLYVPNKEDDVAQEVVSKLHKIKVEELTLSAGYSSNLSGGLINAMNEADEMMTINKDQFKTFRLKKVCGQNLDKMVNTIVGNQLDKMRINLKQLKKNNMADLRNTFDTALSQIDVKELTSNLEIKKKEDSTEEVDDFTALKNKYINEGKFLFGNNQQLVNEYVLASMLSKQPVEGVISTDFFQGMGNKKVYEELMKDKKNHTFSILATDLSGLKIINDTLGHEEGDKAIYDSQSYLKSMLEKNHIKMYSDIIAKGGGNSYAIIEDITKNSKQNVLSDIQKYGLNDDSKLTLSMLCSVTSVNKEDIKKDNFLEVINTNLTKTESELQHQSFSRKVKDVDEMKNSIKKIFEQVINVDDIQLLMKYDLNYKERILNMIKTGFTNCIEKETNHSAINKTINLNMEDMTNKRTKSIADNKNEIAI